MITVTISGKAWSAEPFGSDPFYKMDDPDCNLVAKAAKRQKYGRGYRVTLTGEADILARFAKIFKADGEAWLLGCEDALARNEARECIKAAGIIEEAINKG